MRHHVVLSYKFHPYRSLLVKRFFKIDRNIWNIEEAITIAEKTRVTLLVWSTRLKDEGINLEHENIKVLRLEDGFIRSVGLGVIFTPPISIVADSKGIYFDSTQPSDLEEILNQHSFSPDIIERSLKLIDKIKTQKVNKYNLRGEKVELPKTSKEIVLVVGQVETDKSIKYGSPVIKKNIDLLREVRQRRPDAYIIYKPHPDVVGGYRKGAYPDNVVMEYANMICKTCDNFELIKVVDEVHTINSLMGFEALLWNKRVVCYGQPFYSSWGLTEDMYPVSRRNRKLTLPELVAAALILYPMYRSLITGSVISPEEAIDEIVRLREKKPFKWRLYSLLQDLIKYPLKLRKL
ncbi:MAG: hypothetical protein QXR31_05715 [Zestosphaera sp.]